MDKRIIKPYIEKLFATNVLPNLQEFIKIPNCSPNYDGDWEKNGNAVKAASFLANWVQGLNLKNAEVSLLKDPGHTPFIYIDVKATRPGDDRTILMYGHLDKQPAFTGWSEGLGPQIPVVKDGKLYGRGSSDDGYATFASVSSIKACQDNGWDLPRMVILIEGAEESFTDDLFYYVNQLKTVIGTPSMVMCLDSGCADYERLWVSTNLRGVISISLKVSVMTTQGIHSGLGGGLVPDSFMIIRQLLDRIENPETGDMLEPSLFVEIPEDRNKQIDAMMKVVGDKYLDNIPWFGKTHPLDKNLKDTIIRNTWKPTLVITGCDGLPDTSTAGNVLRGFTELRLSIRLPPGIDSTKAGETIKAILEKDPPYNAKVEATVVNTGDGWNLNSFSEKLGNTLNIASQRFFNSDMCFFGEGGSVPFVKFFNESFPKADFAVLGVCGPTSNIHGPDENLTLDFVQKLMMCLTFLVAEY
jgi:acetylornithine deacetylase/succinyl-diaminopimelate desuccinylase-like protein